MRKALNLWTILISIAWLIAYASGVDQNGDLGKIAAGSVGVWVVVFRVSYGFRRPWYHR